MDWVVAIVLSASSTLAFVSRESVISFDFDIGVVREAAMVNRGYADFLGFDTVS